MTFWISDRIIDFIGMSCFHGKRIAFFTACKNSCGTVYPKESSVFSLSIKKHR